MKRAGVVIVIVIVTGLGFDVSRPRCERVTTWLVPDLIAVASPSLSDAVSLRMWAASSREPAFVYRVSDIYGVTIPGSNWDSEWLEVQPGRLAILPGQNLAILTTPYWAESASEYLAQFEAENTQAVELGGVEAGVERLLLFHGGGGVEGLLDQVVVTDGGEARVWLLESNYEGDTLPAPLEINIPQKATSRLFELATAAKLSEEGRVEWNCGSLDGRTLTMSMWDGSRFGRVSYVNTRHPEGDLAVLHEELRAALGVCDSSYTISACDRPARTATSEDL